MMRRGFTILEMLVATALAAALLLAVFHILGSFGRSRAAMARHSDSGTWRADLIQALRYDLVNATAIDFRRDGITLTGHGALQRTTLNATHEPVTIVYKLVTIRGRRWLVRSQAPRVGLSNDAGWSELLCPDVDVFSVRPANVMDQAAGDSGKDGAATASVPPIVSVSLGGPGGRVIDETLVLR